MIGYYTLPLFYVYTLFMQVKREPLRDRAQTGRSMYALCRKYHGDLTQHTTTRNGRPVPLSSLPLPDFYNIVRKIPYRRDDKPVEVVARPSYLLAGASHGLDCKKKAQLLGSYFTANGLRPLEDWRFVAVSTKPSGSIHHVFPQVNVSGVFLNADATYQYMRLYQPKRVTAFEVLKP